MNTAVVLVHGLFLNGAEFGLLRRRLAAQYGFACHRFSYPTVRGSMSATLDALGRFVQNLDADRVHFVGHSLGGVVLCRYFERLDGECANGARAAAERAGRTVLLGSPLVESRSAKAVANLSWLKRVIGPLVAEELVECCQPRHWDPRHELGLIAGTRPMGLGRFFARFEEDSDGTVAVSETKLPGYTAHLTLPVSHMGMLASAAVAEQVGEFLARGRFRAAG